MRLFELGSRLGDVAQEEHHLKPKRSLGDLLLLRTSKLLEQRDERNTTMFSMKRHVIAAVVLALSVWQRAHRAEPAPLALRQRLDRLER